ncbi:hypothetical protein HY489_03210 [Candidatus Woesearchaeota archaeon]|nr:hypothetical protein [Candidatus Woesearchaeota archaeon]
MDWGFEDALIRPAKEGEILPIPDLWYILNGVRSPSWTPQTFEGGSIFWSSGGDWKYVSYGSRIIVNDQKLTLLAGEQIEDRIYRAGKLVNILIRIPAVKSENGLVRSLLEYPCRAPLQYLESPRISFVSLLSFTERISRFLSGLGSLVRSPRDSLTLRVEQHDAQNTCPIGRHGLYPVESDDSIVSCEFHPDTFVHRRCAQELSQSRCPLLGCGRPYFGLDTIPASPYDLSAEAAKQKH